MYLIKENKTISTIEGFHPTRQGSPLPLCNRRTLIMSVIISTSKTSSIEEEDETLRGRMTYPCYDL